MTDGNDLITPLINTDTESGHYQGLTKREYFAGLAMQGILSSSEDSVSIKHVKNTLGISDDTTYEYPKHWMQYLSITAIAAADALITELNK